MKKHKVLAGRLLGEDIGATANADLCVKDLKDRLELLTKHMRHSEVTE